MPFYAKLDNSKDIINGQVTVFPMNTGVTYLRDEAIQHITSLDNTALVQKLQGSYLKREWSFPNQALAAGTGDWTVSTTGVAAVLAFGGSGLGLFHIIQKVDWSYDNTPTLSGAIQIEDNSQVVWKQRITSAGPGFHEFPKDGLRTNLPNVQLKITLAATPEAAGYLAVDGHKVY